MALDEAVTRKNSKVFELGVHHAAQHISSGCPLIAGRMNLQWAELDQAEPELRDESPSPSPNHYPPSTSPSKTTIHFFIEAAVEFVARDASICALDAAD